MDYNKVVRIGPKEKKSVTPIRRYRFKNTFVIKKIDPNDL